METFIPQGQFTGFIMPRFLNEIDGLSLSAKVLYGALCDHARDKDFCFPSLDYLAKELNASRRSIQNWLKELVGHALIWIENRFNRSSRFFILKHPSMDVFASKKQAAAKAKNFVRGVQTLPDPVQNLPLEETLKKKKDNISPLPPKTETIHENSVSKKGVGGDLSPNVKNFEAFWAEYPRKDAYYQAKKLWLRLVRQGVLPSMEKLRECLKRFLATAKWQRENGRYVPYLVNFLHGRLWLDLSHDEQKDAQKEAADAAWRSMETARIEKIKAENAAKSRKETEELFEPFLKCFEDGEENRHAAFTRWVMLKSLYRKTLTANDVTENVGVLDFLNRFRKI